MNFDDDLSIEYYEVAISFSSEDVDKFAMVSGDFNPLHLNEKFAITQGFSNRIVHGALLISKVSGIIASDFPGAGTILGSIEWKFISPVLINQQLKLKFTLSKTSSRKCILELVVVDDAERTIQESRMIIFTRK